MADPDHDADIFLDGSNDDMQQWSHFSLNYSAIPFRKRKRPPSLDPMDCNTASERHLGLKVPLEDHSRCIGENRNSDYGGDNRRIRPAENDIEEAVRGFFAITDFTEMPSLASSWKHFPQ